ncbi:LysR family transcriptional regulator [Roseicella frigidaeris]|uniref:LysR family transcriptional regulator n=1 Tax=Roseicella frigidaeris TaxID=2230885 RepID=A0A327M4V0_9PROT|nr:LysR family transcriptional regulator [Roseicella frigidaeris]RAI57799.1 LysR family transcriptional regulator [Roseicella frigidaeris]
MSRQHIPDLSARQLLAVLTLAEQGSFVAAAATLACSQPALTRSIRRVEDVLGVALFERTTRRVRLTAAGREFLPTAERLLHELGMLARSLSEIAAESRGQVVLACIMSAATGVLPGLLAAWTAARPGVELQVREGVHGHVLAEVQAGAADFGLTYVDALPPGLVAEPLGQAHFVAVAPPGHALARREEPVALASLAGERLIAFPPDSRTRRIIEAAASDAGLTLRPRLTVTQFATMLRLVRAGAGLAIVPATAVAGSAGEGLAVLPLAPPGLSRRVGLVTQAGRTPSPPAAGLMGALRDGWPGGASMQNLE